MKEIEITELGIKILLKCNKKPISKHDVTQLYKPYKKEEREKIINELVIDNYLEIKKTPKPDTKRTPTYYFITHKGKKWVEDYLALFSEQ